MTAMDLIERFEPGLVVCDMSLEVGSGMDIIRFLALRALPCQVVVFTSFDEMISPVEGFPVRVVSKPDFERLEQALDAAILDANEAVVVRERRQLVRSTPNPGLRQDSGLDDPSEFYRQLAEAVRGDVLLTVRVTDDDLTEVAGALRKAVRVQDLLIRRHDELTALLIGGGPAGARPRSFADSPRPIHRPLTGRPSSSSTPPCRTPSRPSSNADRQAVESHGLGLRCVDVVGGHGSSDVAALAGIAAERDDPLELLLGLDTFGDDCLV